MARPKKSRGWSIVIIIFCFLYWNFTLGGARTWKSVQSPKQHTNSMWRTALGSQCRQCKNKAKHHVDATFGSAITYESKLCFRPVKMCKTTCGRRCQSRLKKHFDLTYFIVLSPGISIQYSNQETLARERARFKRRSITGVIPIASAKTRCPLCGYKGRCHPGGGCMPRSSATCTGERKTKPDASIAMPNNVEIVVDFPINCHQYVESIG